MKFNIMSAFVGLLLLWGATWLPIFLTLIAATLLGYYKPEDEESKRKWQTFVRIAFPTLLLIYLIYFHLNNVGLN